MNIIDITGDNIDAFLPVSEWLIEDIERGRFLAMGALEDEKPVGGSFLTCWRFQQLPHCAHTPGTPRF